jgi:mono/diheme cytochrome c family protein
VTPLARLAVSGLFAVATVGAAVATHDAATTARTVSAPTARRAGALDGRQVFLVHGCVVCHEQAHTAPSLTGLAERAGERVDGLDAEAYIRQSVREPQAFLVPGYAGPVKMPTLNVSDAELDALATYLLTR